MEMKKTAFYPGCSLEGASSGYAASMKAVFGKLGVDTPELEGWNCCGATSAHAIDHQLYLGLNLKNLANAEALGYEEILAPCAACYHRLASAQAEFSAHPETLEEMNKKTGLNYKGSIKIRNILDFLANVVRPSGLRPHVSNPLSGLKAVCYYGCLNTRVPGLKCFDTVDYPMSMDKVAESVGVDVRDWSYKTECCGASLFITAGDVSSRLVSKIIKDAEAHGADCIVAACPMCQSNLDMKQEEIRAQYGISRPIPIIFITQLIGLAMGIDESVLKLGQSLVPFELEKQR